MMNTKPQIQEAQGAPKILNTKQQTNKNENSAYYVQTAKNQRQKENVEKRQKRNLIPIKEDQ